MKCTRDLTSSDVCDIIKACAKGNVVSFDYQGLSIRFDPVLGQERSDVAGQPHDTPYYVPKKDVLPPDMEGEQEDLRERFDVQDKALLEDVRRMNAMVTDPLSWEEEQIDACIEEDRQRESYLNG